VDFIIANATPYYLGTT